MRGNTLLDITEANTLVLDTTTSGRSVGMS